MKYKILTSDDSKMVRVIVARTFSPFNCEILEAGTGTEALEVVAKHSPDLIILDITMPDMTGLEVLKTLRANPVTASIPVVMLTAESANKTVEEADRLSVSGYIAKPFKPEQLLAQVKSIIDLQPA
ncbi:MAG: response regulator [Verrucomicrobia bacterium]|jgi:CheY-like chemotaxis protein|nr:response regulator [Verrucomicrobiota bacterium]